MRRFFIVSDIHSFYKELRIGLKNAGFDIKNKEHVLVILGDIFDRGSETVKVYNFIKRIPKYRRVLVKGNHEDLYLELLKKPLPEFHDYTNKTVSTFTQIANYDENASWDYYDQIREIVKTHPITKFIKSKEWKDYYIINNKYICVHSFIPTDCEDWKNATPRQWFKSRWGCPYEQYQNGYFGKEKEQGHILVCGHWHTNDFFINLGNDPDSKEKGIYYGDNIIAIDGGVWGDRFGNIIHDQNVLVIDEQY